MLAAATAVVWVKDPSDSPANQEFGWLSISTTVVVLLLAGLTVFAMAQMFTRLHTPAPEASSLHLRTGKGKSVGSVPEFFVAGDPPPGGIGAGPSGGSASAARRSAAPPPDERSNLLCLEREGKR